jgi:hypothetical protein
MGQNLEQREEPKQETEESRLAPMTDELSDMRSYIGYLPPLSASRRLAEAVLAGDQPDRQVLVAALSRLDRFDVRRWREQELVARAVGMARLSTDQKEVVSENLARFHGKGLPAGLMSCKPWVWLVAIALVVALQLLPQPLRGVSPFAPVLVGGVVGALAIRDRRWVRVGESTVTALGRIGYRGSVPYLSWLALNPYDTPKIPPRRAAAVRALAAVLPALRPSDADWLHQGTVWFLARGLRYGDERLVLAILDAFTKVGDARVLRVVEQVAASTRSGPVREAAERTLEAIRARVAAANDAAHLLRPASSPEAETLLRPACGPGEADADVLLRPSEASRE